MHSMYAISRNKGRCMNMTDKKITDLIEKLKIWLASDEGKESMKIAGEKSRKIAKDMEDRTKVTDEMLKMRVNYKY